MKSCEHRRRLAILQRVCTGYRASLFRRLAAEQRWQVRVFIGADLPLSKVRSASDLSRLDVVRLPTQWIRVGRRSWAVHRGLVRALRRYRPDAILCEGESNMLSGLAALRYRMRYRHVGVVHWSLGGLPGAVVRPGSVRGRLKYLLQRRFDGFVVYSSFGKDMLLRLGHSAERIFVATNVSDTQTHLARAREMTDSRSQARAKLGLPDRFTVLYVGALDESKRLEHLLYAMEGLDPDLVNVVVVGDGPMMPRLRQLAEARGLASVQMPGRVTRELPLYYRASDVFVLPGRGGMVISEAMAYALPVIVYQADGTEYDLVRHRGSGLRLTRGDVQELRNAITFCHDNPHQAAAWGRAGQKLVTERFTQDHMVRRILEALDAACTRRTRHRMPDDIAS